MEQVRDVDDAWSPADVLKVDGRDAMIVGETKVLVLRVAMHDRLKARRDEPRIEIRCSTAEHRIFDRGELMAARFEMPVRAARRPSPAEELRMKFGEPVQHRIEVLAVRGIGASRKSRGIEILEHEEPIVGDA